MKQKREQPHEEKKSKADLIVTLIVTIVLLLLVFLLLAESVQLADIKNKMEKTQIFWAEFGNSTNEAQTPAYGAEGEGTI